MTLTKKIKLKKFLFHLLGIAVLTTILVIAWLFGKLFEISTTVILFFVFRPLFIKQFHAESMYTCAGISIIVFIIVSYVAIPKNISLLMSVITTFVINSISYYVRDYLDVKGFIKKLDNNMVSLANVKTKFPNLTDLESEIYVAYVHKGRKPISQLADEFNYSERQFYRILKIIKDKTKTLK